MREIYKSWSPQTVLRTILFRINQSIFIFLSSDSLKPSFPTYFLQIHCIGLFESNSFIIWARDSNCVHTSLSFIYIYIEREREREREISLIIVILFLQFALVFKIFYNICFWKEKKMSNLNLHNIYLPYIPFFFFILIVIQFNYIINIFFY